MDSLTELFCEVDDFYQAIQSQWERHLLESNNRQRRRQSRLSMSEVMTIVIHFHQQQYRNFKAYYTHYVQVHLQREFPQLVSYTRFVELQAQAMVPLLLYLHSLKGKCSGISFMDSTPLAVCANRRIPRHRVFRGIAQRGKTSMGWFYGFKLHLVVNDQGQLLSFCLTAGNVADVKTVPTLARDLFGKLIADKGYISNKLFRQLYADGVQLITGIRKNMRPLPMPIYDRILRRKRALIETIFDQLKNISQIEHSRHRSGTNFVVNLLAGLIAYCRQPKKPALQWTGKPILISN